MPTPRHFGARLLKSRLRCPLPRLQPLPSGPAQTPRVIYHRPPPIVIVKHRAHGTTTASTAVRRDWR